MRSRTRTATALLTATAALLTGLPTGAAAHPTEAGGGDLSIARAASATFFQIHVWLWKHNPAGTFSDHNPRGGCSAAG